MDKRQQYIDSITSVLEDYYHKLSQNPSAGVREQLSFDLQRGHFQILSIGWQQNQFIFAIIMHIDIIGDKIWIQQNNTEVMLADELIQKGISKSDIVLGFQPPSVRPHTGFAVA
jgi:hypothetical protein